MIWIMRNALIAIFILTPLILSIELPIEIINEEDNISNLRALKMQKVDVNQMGFNIAIKNISIGYPPQPVSLLVSINSKNTWIIEDNLTSGFNRKRSQTYRVTNETSSLKYKDAEYKGTEITDKISIGQAELLDYPFCVTEANDNWHNNLYNGALGLGYHYKDIDRQYSFIDQAKKAQIVSRSIYSLNLFNADNTGVFSFGDYPKELNSKSTKYYRTCSLKKYNEDNEPNIAWECNLDSIYFEGKYELYPVKRHHIFSIDHNSIMVTSTFWKYFLKEIANKFIESKDCTRVVSNQYDFISCNDSFDVRQFGSISFIIGKNTYTVTTKNYFKQDSRQQLCLVYHFRGFERFALGLPLFREYLSVFDKETDRVGFIKYSHLQ